MSRRVDARSTCALLWNMAKARRNSKAKKPSKWEVMREELEALAQRLDVKVRYDARVPGEGGYCRIRSPPCVFVNSTLPASEQVHVLAQSLRAARGEEGVEAAYVRPDLRDLFESLVERS